MSLLLRELNQLSSLLSALSQLLPLSAKLPFHLWYQLWPLLLASSLLLQKLNQLSLLLSALSQLCLRNQLPSGQLSFCLSY